MIIQILNRIVGLIEELQIKDEKHSKVDTEVSEMIRAQQEEIKLLLDRIEKLENSNF